MEDCLKLLCLRFSTREVMGLLYLITPGTGGRDLPSVSRADSDMAHAFDPISPQSCNLALSIQVINATARSGIELKQARRNAAWSSPHQADPCAGDRKRYASARVTASL